MSGLLASGCEPVRARFAEYLDGCLAGKEMQAIAAHMSVCPECASEFRALRRTQSMLAGLGPVREPQDLLLRIRVAVSQERARLSRGLWERGLARFKLTWANGLGHYVWQFSAGLVSAVLLLGTVGALVGMVAQPERAHAAATDDVPLGSETAPRLLYLSNGSGTSVNDVGSVVIEAYVDDQGRAYDYRIMSGEDNAEMRGQVEALLLSSVFEPARSYGRPVRGLAMVSFVSVHA